MAAPTSNITWGNEVIGSTDNRGKIGLYTVVSSTATTSTVTVEVWYWSRWSISDSTNSYYYNMDSTNATTLIGSVAINHTSNTSWSTANQTRLGAATYTYNRGSSDVTHTCAAKFTGIDKNGSSNIMTVTRSFTIPALNKVYKQLTVKYNKNDGSGDTATQTFTEGASGNKFGYNTSGSPLWGTTGQFGAWDRAGYKLLGWHFSSTSNRASYPAYGEVSDQWIIDNCPNNTGTVNLYAIWEPIKYTITFNANGGLTTPHAKTFLYGENAYPRIRPTRPGYKFLGWGKTASTTTISWEWEDPITAADALAYPTIYAIWEARPDRNISIADDGWTMVKELREGESIALHKTGALSAPTFIESAGRHTMSGDCEIYANKIMFSSFVEEV